MGRAHTCCVRVWCEERKKGCVTCARRADAWGGLLSLLPALCSNRRHRAAPSDRHCLVPTCPRLTCPPCLPSIPPLTLPLPPTLPPPTLTPVQTT